MNDKASYRAILRSSSIMGAASVANVLIGLVRMKAVAVLLGPAGVGMIGLFQNVVATASTLASCGVAQVGTRRIAQAAAAGDDVSIAAARRALFWGTLALASIGGLVFLLTHRHIARGLIQDPLRSADVGWLSVAVVLTVASGSQTALLNGLRRIGDLARLQVSSAVLSTCLGLVALALWRDNGLAFFVISAPLASFLLGHWFVRRVGPVSGPPVSLHRLRSEWGDLLRLGTAFMLSGLIALGGQLGVRALVQRELGPEALGHFQAVWTISMTYIGFVLSSMATDYYPRLAGVIGDRQSAAKLVKEQTEVALMLAGPVIIGVLVLAPWIVPLLYSSDFSPAIDLLRWQLLGDVLKVTTWPLAFVIMASGAGKTFLATEIITATIFIAGTWLLLPVLGIKATGVAFCMMYLLYVPLVQFAGGRRIRYKWSLKIVTHATALFALGLFFSIVDTQAFWALALGIFSTLMLALWGALRLMAERGEKI